MNPKIIVEAIWKIHSEPDLRSKMVKNDGERWEYMLVGDIAKIANILSKEQASPHLVGRIIRNELRLEMSMRQSSGYRVYWDEARMRAFTEELFMHELNAPTLFDGIEQLGGQG